MKKRAFTKIVPVVYNPQALFCEVGTVSVITLPKIDPALFTLFPDILQLQQLPNDDLRLELTLTKAVGNIAAFEKNLQTLGKTANVTLSIVGQPEIIEPLLPGLKKNVNGQIRAFRYVAGQKAPTRLVVMNLVEFLQNCPQLTTLDLSQCGKLTQKNLLSLLQAKSRGLVELNLASCSQLKSEDLDLVKNSALRTFSLASCPEISEEALIRFLETSGQNLERLDLTKCKVTSNLCSHLPISLTHLLLPDVNLTYEAICSLLDRLKNLQELDVGYPENLGSLKVLSLTHLALFITSVTAKMPAEHVKFVCSRLLKGPPKPEESLVKKIDSWAQSHSLHEISGQCQSFYKGVVVAPPPVAPTRVPSPPPPVKPVPLPVPVVEEMQSVPVVEMVQYDSFEQKSKKDRSVLTLKEKLNIRFESIPEGLITIKIDADMLDRLDEKSPSVHLVKRLGTRVDKLLFSAQGGPPREKGLANLHHLVKAFPAVRRLKFVDGRHFRPQFITCFRQSLYDLHLASFAIDFDLFTAVVDKCQLLQRVVCTFAFSKEAFEKASASTLLCCMLIDFPNLSRDFAETISQRYLSQMDQLVHPVRKQVIAFCMKYQLFASLDACLQMLNHESPCALEIDKGFTTLKLLVVGLKPESSKWKEVEETLDLIYTQGKFVGAIALEVDSEALQVGSQAFQWLDLIVKRYGDKIARFKGEEPATDTNVCISPFLDFAAKLTSLQHLELFGVDVRQDERQTISQLTDRLESVMIDESSRVSFVEREETEHEEDQAPVVDEPPENFDDIVSLLYCQENDDKKNQLVAAVAKREIVPLQFLSRLLEVSQSVSELVEPSIEWINAYFDGWIVYDGIDNTATVTFAKGCVPSWLSEMTYKSIINVIEFLHDKRKTLFRSVYFEEFDALPAEVKDTLYQVTSALTFISWESKSWELLLREYKNLSQVSFGACAVTYSQLAGLLARSVDVRYDEVSGLGVIDTLTAVEIRALFSLLAKDNQTEALDDALTLTSTQFAALFAANLPEHERYCMKRFNKAFGDYAWFETAHTLRLFPCKALTGECELVIENLANVLQLNVEIDDRALRRENKSFLAHMLGLLARSVKGITVNNSGSLSAKNWQSLYALDEALDAIMTCVNLTSFALENSVTSGKTLAQLAKACPKVVDVRLVNCPNIAPTTMHGVLAKWNLVYLCLAYNRALTDSGLATIVEGLAVVELDLSGNFSLTDAAFKPLSKLKELRSLYLNGCQNLTLQQMPAFFQLEKLHLAQCKKVQHEAIVKCIEQNRHIVSLNLSENPHVNASTFLMLKKYCPGLRELRIADCYQLTKSDILELASAGFLHLRLLDLDCCMEMDEEVLKTVSFFIPTLLSTSVCGCPNLPVSLTAILSAGLDRSVEEILPCSRATDTTLNILTFKYPRLRRFHLEHSPDLSLYEFTAALRKWEDLEALAVVGHPLTSDSVITAILANAPGLTTLFLEACRYLTDDALLTISQQGKKLRHLKLAESPKFSDRAIGALLQNLADLKRLELVACPLVTLHEVVAPSKELVITHLRIINCPNITNEALMAFVTCCTYLVELEISGQSQITTETLQAIKANSRRLQNCRLS